MFSTTHGHTQRSIQKTDGLINSSLLTQVHDFIPKGEMNLYRLYTYGQIKNDYPDEKCIIHNNTDISHTVNKVVISAYIFPILNQLTRFKIHNILVFFHRHAAHIKFIFTSVYIRS